MAGNGAGRALAVTDDDDQDDTLSGEIVDADVPLHVLRLGEAEFVCADTVPYTTVVRYADNDLLAIHHILVKLVAPEELDAMWDEAEKLTRAEFQEAYQALIRSYSARPTKRPSSSRGGSRRTSQR